MRWRRWAQGDYQDVAGLCYSASVDEIAHHGYVLTPGRYVGAELAERTMVEQVMREKLGAMGYAISLDLGTSRGSLQKDRKWSNTKRRKRILYLILILGLIR